MKTTNNIPNGQHDVVQVKNPKSGHYVKIDRTEGKIISHKKSDGPYKDVPFARKRKWYFIALLMEMLLLALLKVSHAAVS